MLQHQLKASLSRQKSKLKTYWTLRWFGSDGRHRGQTIGRADGPNSLSRRHAELRRLHKEQEINERPGRRDASSWTLSCLFDFYTTSKRSELALGTLRLYQQAAKYLFAYFGKERLIDHITKADARAFKTALANGDLMYVNKLRKTKPTPSTVDKHVRTVRSLFNFAKEDDFILDNPFNKLSKTIKIERAWHYVTKDEYQKLMTFAPNTNWRLLISLCRLAGLRRGEALDLEWSDIDWGEHRLQIIGSESWQPKDRESRIVPIFPELYKILLTAYDDADAGQKKVIEGLCATNTWRDFQVLFRRAGVKPYSKPCHSLRKNAITDWASNFPAHVVKEWAGHSSLETTDRYYLQVSESEYTRAAQTSFFGDFAQLFAKLDKNKEIDKSKENRIDLLQKGI